MGLKRTYKRECERCGLPQLKFTKHGTVWYYHGCKQPVPGPQPVPCEMRLSDILIEKPRKAERRVTQAPGAPLNRYHDRRQPPREGVTINAERINEFRDWVIKGGHCRDYPGSVHAICDLALRALEGPSAPQPPEAARVERAPERRKDSHTSGYYERAEVSARYGKDRRNAK